MNADVGTGSGERFEHANRVTEGICEFLLSDHVEERLGLSSLIKQIW